MKTPNLEQFKVWAKENQSLAMAVCAATAFAQLERERVNEYTKPIFQRYEFRDEGGKPITDPDRLYQSEDHQLSAAYYGECNRANRAHGWNGPEDHCPALTAEDRQVKVEQTLLDSAAELLEIDRAWSTLENRKKMLDNLLGGLPEEVKPLHLVRTIKELEQMKEGTWLPL